MNRIAYASISVVLACSGLAFAEGMRGEHDAFARWDRDGNGVVSREEARATALEHFDRMDQNHDGRLVPAELAAFGAEQGAKRFAEKDKNGDGQLSRAEVPNMPQEMFTHLDKNGDGQISSDEFAQGHEHMKGFAEARFAAADTDHDGAVTRDEALAEADRRFAEFDTNHDGAVTPEEAKAAMKAHGWHGPRHPKATEGR